MHFKQFCEEILSKFSKIFSKFPINCLFSPNAQKINSCFVKFFEKYSKIMHFSQFSFENFYKDSKILWKFFKYFFDYFWKNFWTFFQYFLKIFWNNFWIFLRIFWKFFWKSVPPPKKILATPMLSTIQRANGLPSLSSRMY